MVIQFELPYVADSFPLQNSRMSFLEPGEFDVNS